MLLGTTSEPGAWRGKTFIVDTPLLANAVRKSRLYCAMPPRPPNASVTRARTSVTRRAPRLAQLRVR